MATYNWSALANGQTIDPFNPDVDIINFDDPLISAAAVAVTGDTEAATPYTTLSYGGKTITFNTSPLALTAAGSASHVNVTFADGSLLLIGDNTTGTVNDDSANTLTGGSGNDQIIGIGGADSLTGGGGNDLFTMYSDLGAWGNDTIRGDGGIDAINFNTGDANVGLTVTYVGFDVGLGALASITGGGGGNTITMSGVERVTGTHLADTFTGTVATPINGLNSDVTLVFDGAGGNDVFTGATGDGRNTVISYRTAESGVTVNLSTGTTTNDGLGGFDNFTNIDGVFGSNFADSITGGSASRSISGGGFEFFEGFSGNDTINGGSNSDRVQYVNSPGAVTVNLAAGTASDGWVGAITKSTTVDTNGAWGLSDTAVSNLLVNGDTLTVKGPGLAINFSRVTDGSNALVGSWLLGGTVGVNAAVVVTFLSDGSYFLAEDGDSVADPSGQDGMERGTYTWNSLTGAFTRVTVTDTNGEWGLSHGDVTNFQVTGNTLTGTDSEGSFELSRVTTAGNPLVGGWYVTNAGEANSAAVITFLSDGTYLMAEDGNSVIDPSGQDGMERGTFTWNPLAGTDTLINIEQVRGSGFADTLTGDTNDNRLIGDGGNDVLNGGDGTDEASYQFATNAVSVNLATGTATDIGGTSNGTDTLISIESVRGTDFADSLVGGGAGVVDDGAEESFEGRAGNDTIDGGDGDLTGSSIDIASYVTSPSGVIVNLSAGPVLSVATNTANDGYGVNGNPAGIDTLININGIEGSSFNDTLVGSAIPVFFDPRGGSDSVVGGTSTNDWVTYWTAPAGANVNLTSGAVTDGWGGNDTLSGIEDVEGTNFNDILTGNALSNDLNGLSGDDSLLGADGDDRLEGRDGDDTLTGGLGNDTLVGSDGNDWAIYSGATGSVTVNLALGTATGTEGNDTLSGVENVVAGNFDDTLTGDDNANFLRGGAGNDSLDGGGQSLSVTNGNIQGDFADYQFAAGAVTVSLAIVGAQNTIGAGNDTLLNFESLRGSSNADTLTGDGGNNFLRGGAGNDTLNGGAGIDWADYRNSTSSVNVILGNNDTSPGSSSSTSDGADTLNSIEGVSGSDSPDTLTGGTGDDWFRGRNGNDSINGGGGYDTVTYRPAGGGVTVNLGVVGVNVSGAEGSDTLSGIEAVEGSFFYADNLTGDNLPGVGNDIFGLGGNDLLRVTRGDDLLDGGTGTDRIDFTQTLVNYTGATGVTVNLATHVADLNNNSGSADEISTLASIETVTGTAGNDSLTGGDTTHARDGQGNNVQESFQPGGGNDTITGGGLGAVTAADQTQFSTQVDYSSNLANQAVSANLGTGVVNDGQGGTDTLFDVARVRGGAGDDSLVGGSLGRGSTGTFFEIFRGNGGNDTLNGSNATSDGNAAGNDRADYGNNTSTQAINVNLATGIVLDGLGGTDVLIDVNQIFGGAGNDSFLGGSANDTFDGGIGFDTLDGAAGGGDQARFDQSTGGVIVNLSSSSIVVGDITVLAGTANDGMFGTDTLISIESVQGSEFDDHIRGSDDVNERQFLSGNSGSDTIDGGAGIDFANYSDVPLVLGGINAFIESGSGTVNDKTGGTDTLINIEGLGGTNANDTLTGGLGDQWFRGNGGSDSIVGGADNDWVLYSNSPSGVMINLDNGTATDGYNGLTGLLNLGGNDTLVGIENAEASDFNDTITGSSAANELRGRAGNDSLDGLGGVDTLKGGTGDDTYVVESASDVVTENASEGTDLVQSSAATYTLAANVENLTLTGSAGINGIGNTQINNLVGNTGNNSLTGSGGNDAINGGIGVDTAVYSGNLADYTITPGANTTVSHLGGAGADGVDTLTGIEKLQFADQLYDLIINQNISGTTGNDSIPGWLGNDSINGLGGNDTLEGSGGNDTLAGGAGIDTLDGGTGTDTADYSGTAAGISVALWNNTVANDGQGGSDALISIETVLGSNFNDTLVGSSAANRFEGADGNDRLFADAGNDTLFGGNGNDTLAGGAGNDTLDGGAGVDVADYFSVGAGISVTLWNTTVANDGQGGSDALISIETVLGSNFNDTLVGSVAANRFEGADGDDRLFADAGNDTLFGGNGNDTLAGGAGNDTLDGGAGVDVADYFSVGAGISVTLWNTTVANDGQGGSDALISIETVLGSNFNDTLVGSVAANRFEGADGNDRLFADAGNDTLFGGNGNDTLAGGAGNDTLDGGAGVDVADYFSVGAGISVTLWNTTVANDGQGGSDALISIETVLGSNFNDTLVGSVAANRFEGADGDDRLFADAGNDTLFGGNGNDTLAGGAGNDTLDGGAGVDVADYFSVGAGISVTLWNTTVANDGQGGSDALISIETVLGSNFNDTLVGSVAANRFEGADGDDRLFADAGNDTLFGGNGNDTLAGGAGNDTLDGGAGVDVADYFSVGAGISVTLWNTTVANDGQGGSDALISIETVLGSNFNDTLVGSSAANRFEGADGNDLMFADAGADTLIGGAGNDILAGGSGSDVLTGGAGVDAFRFDFVLGASNIDTITDFVVVDDTIQLENAVFTSLATPGALAAGSFVSGSGVAALDADDYILYDFNTGALYYDADGNLGDGPLQFATLNTMPTITASDFMVV